jgi:uncharacterized protein (TIGR02145 family)
MKIKFIFLLFIGVITNVCFSQTEITINSQTWSKKNLSVSMFRNGDGIKQVKTLAEFNAADEAFEPAWMHYLNNPANDAKYGKIYNWWAVIDDRGLAPEGWHIPSEKDWEILFCSYSEKMDLTGKIPGKSLGKVYSCIYNAVDEGVFHASSFGSRSANGEVISRYNDGDKAGHWSTTRYSNSVNNILYCDHLLSHLSTYGNPSYGLSVLCVKDKTNPFIPKVDSNMIEHYPKPIVLKNGQVWCTDYLNVTTFRNGDTIPEANEDWLWEKYIRNKKPAWCYSKRGKGWGILYNYYAVIDARGIAPKGLRIPTGTEWGNSRKFDIDKDIFTKQNIPIWKIGNRRYHGDFENDYGPLTRQELGTDYAVWVVGNNTESIGYPIICIYDY